MARRGRVIDFKEWRLLAGATQTFSTVGTRVASAVLAFTAPATILRIRCHDILLMLDSTQQVGDTIILTLGLGIVSSDAAALGATALPDPGAEAEYPWLWWGQSVLRSEVAAGVNDRGSSMYRFGVDSKAMRRVKPGQSLLWVIEASGLAGAPVTLIDVCSTRVLVGT